MLDSGAYSQMMGKANIDLDRYAAFLKVCGNLFDYVINLDIEPENFDVRNWNLARLKKVYARILPVVHDVYAGEIDMLYDQGYDYILIGSSRGNDRRQLDFIFNRYYFSGKYPGIKFHKLGTATYATLAEYPFYSSDSAVFEIVAGMGRVFFWNEYRLPNKNGDRTDIIYFGGRLGSASRGVEFSRYPYLGEFEDYLWRNFGYTLREMINPKGNEWALVNLRYGLELQKVITQLHGV